jgi:hypothetical protein
MLSSIKFDFQADSAEDFEIFKVLFIRNAGIAQMIYDFYLGDVLIRLQCSSINDYQLVGIGFFHYSKQGNSVSLEQFNPLQDIRFTNFNEIKRLWYITEAWAFLSYSPENAESSFSMIHDVLKIVARINNLKAFL